MLFRSKPKDDIQKEWDQDCKAFSDTPLPSVLPAVRRIIAIGDLHGDWKVTIESLKIAGVIDENNKKLKTSFYYSENSNDYKHDHVIFYFNKGIKLIYNDVRKFGFIKIYNKKTIFSSTHLAHLGPEPLTKDFNKKYFFNYIKKREINIKDLLMSQKFVSGLGNIYCNEKSNKKNTKRICSRETIC